MAVEIFKASDGMLTIEKRDPDNFAQPISDIPRKIVLNWNRIMDTAFTYQQPDLAIIEKGKGTQCNICGAITDYPNQYICRSCWAHYNNDILRKMKQFTEEWLIELDP